MGKHSENGSREEERREEAYSRKVRAGKRTYFIDVKSTRSEDFYLTITESKRKARPDGSFAYEKHKIFLYKEDFDKFALALGDCIARVKEEFMPDTDFSAFEEEAYEREADEAPDSPANGTPRSAEGTEESVFDEELKWD